MLPKSQKARLGDNPAKSAGIPNNTVTVRQLPRRSLRLRGFLGLTPECPLEYSSSDVTREAKVTGSGELDDIPDVAYPFRMARHMGARVEITVLFFHVLLILAGYPDHRSSFLLDFQAGLPPKPVPLSVTSVLLSDTQHHSI